MVDSILHAFLKAKKKRKKKCTKTCLHSLVSELTGFAQTLFNKKKTKQKFHPRPTRHCKTIHQMTLRIYWRLIFVYNSKLLNYFINYVVSQNKNADILWICCYEKFWNRIPELRLRCCCCRLLNVVDGSLGAETRLMRRGGHYVD